MALFKKKPKLANIPFQTTTELWTKTFPQSGSFKGFRRIKLTTYGEDLVQDTLAYFAQNGYNFKGCTIKLESLSITGTFTDRLLRVVNVFVDGKRIGCVYDNDAQRYALLANSEYDKVHLRVEDGEVYLFVHII
jgi:hypothetical protein